MNLVCTVCISIFLLGDNCDALCKTSNKSTNKKLKKLSNEVSTTTANHAHSDEILKCKCGKDEGTANPASICTDGFCTIKLSEGACRTGVFCNRTRQMWLDDKIGLPHLDCLELRRRSYTYAVYDCVSLKWNDFHKVVPSCSTSAWNKEAIGCCKNHMCNEHIDPVIDGVHSNLIFHYPEYQVIPPGKTKIPLGVPDGYPCNDVSDCRNANGHVWCRNKWNARQERNPEVFNNTKVCCSQQLGLNTVKNKLAHACCGSNAFCDIVGTSGHCKCARRALVLFGSTNNEEKPDGMICQSETECLSRICAAKDEGQKVCCTGTDIGSYCSEAHNISCCGKGTFCGTDKKCNSRGVGGKCVSNSDCADGQCQLLLIRNVEFQRIINEKGYYAELPSIPVYSGSTQTFRFRPGYENAHVCCKGALGDVCPTCATKLWEFAGPCHGCCEGLTCLKGKCSNLVALGGACEHNFNCASGRCVAGYCCQYSLYERVFRDSALPFGRSHLCSSHVECCGGDVGDKPKYNPYRKNGNGCCEILLQERRVCQNVHSGPCIPL